MKWSEEQLTDYQRRRGLPTAQTMSMLPASPTAGCLALGRLKTGKMNKTEAAYDAHLWQLRHAGEILWHKFEGIKLRLADNTFYTPDFAVMLANGAFEFHEVKGFMMEDANVKIKVAAEMFPFGFWVVKKSGSGFSVVQYG